MTTEPKKIDLGANSFEANGVKYLVHDTLSVRRFEQLEILQAELAWGIDFASHHQNLHKLNHHLNKIELVKAAVLVNNMLEGMARKVEERHNPVMLICTLFMCREGENVAEWNATEAAEKIEDWRAEGIDVAFFFSYAFASVPGFTAAYRAALQGISQASEIFLPDDVVPETPQKGKKKPSNPSAIPSATS
jgi:hypothetical protein